MLCSTSDTSRKSLFNTRVKKQSKIKYNKKKTSGWQRTQLAPSSPGLFIFHSYRGCPLRSIIPGKTVAQSPIPTFLLLFEPRLLPLPPRHPVRAMRMGRFSGEEEEKKMLSPGPAVISCECLQDSSWQKANRQGLCQGMISRG